MAAQTTRATDALDSRGIQYQVHLYDVEEKVGQGYGEAVARAIGLSGDRVFKTLLALVDDEPVVAVVPVERRLSNKRLARALGGKKSTLLAPAEAERLTGYVTGGISPFGQRRQLRLCLDSSAADHDTIAVSGGRRGLQLELDPQSVLAATGGALAPIADD